MLLLRSLLGLVDQSHIPVFEYSRCVHSWPQNLDIVMLSGHATILQDVSNFLSIYSRYVVRVILGF